MRYGQRRTNVCNTTLATTSVPRTPTKTAMVTISPLCIHDEWHVALPAVELRTGHVDNSPDAVDNIIWFGAWLFYLGILNELNGVNVGILITSSYVDPVGFFRGRK